MKKRVSRRPEHDPGRRRFLRSAAGGAAAVAVGGPALLAACNDDATAPAGRAKRSGGRQGGRSARRARRASPFYGTHQAGVLLRAPESGIVRRVRRAGRGSRDELRDAFRALSDRGAEADGRRTARAARPSVPAHRLGRVRRRVAAVGAERHRRCRRVAVRRPLRPRVAQATRAREDAVHRQRPARSRDLARRRVVDDLGRAPPT